MSRTASTMLPLETPAPDFVLPDPRGDIVSLSRFADAPALVIIFMCNHCPYVKHLKPALATFARDYLPKHVAVVGINSNDTAEFPEDAPERMVEDIEAFDYRFPYLVDGTQEIAKAYGAACTPDFFLFNVGRRLVYRGQFDNSRPNDGLPVTGESLRSAVDAVLAGSPVPGPQTPSLGCNIKWKPNNAPDYFAG
ncbi:MAG: thioredoxin family protein [Acidimicrobiales bacterium]|nr:thioredoxin family protein [Acidimicrobiales bacterium]